MLIFDNIIFSLQRAGGISAVWANLISNILKTGSPMMCLEFDDALHNIFRSKINIPSANLSSLGRKASKLHEFVAPSIDLNEKFIFHSSYFRVCPNRNAINVATVHDFIYEQGKPTLKQRLRIHLDYKAIRQSDAIVCVSESTRRDLFRYLPEIEPDKVSVIHNGVSDYFSRLTEKPYPQYSGHLLFVGGRQSYKNFKFLVEALSLSDFKLLICGAPLSKEELTMLEKHISGRYDTIVFPSNEDLNAIYNSVYALVYPSSYEGFGIPVLEAQRAGCPVIAFNASSIPEVIGDDALLLNELSADSLYSKLEELKLPGRREQLIASGIKNSMRFSWNKMASEYLQLYNNLLTR